MQQCKQYQLGFGGFVITCPGWDLNPKPLYYCCLRCFPLAPRGQEVCAKIGWILVWCNWITGLVLLFVFVLIGLQQTAHKPNTCSLLQGYGFEPQLLPNFFFIWMFILRIANGAKVGLKLRLHINDAIAQSTFIKKRICVLQKDEHLILSADTVFLYND